MTSAPGGVRGPSPFNFLRKQRPFAVEWHLFGEFLAPLFEGVVHPWAHRVAAWADCTPFTQQAGQAMCSIMHAAARANDLAPPQAVAAIYVARLGGPRPPPLPPAGPRPPLTRPPGRRDTGPLGAAAVHAEGFGRGGRGHASDQGRFLGFDAGPGGVRGMAESFGMQARLLWGLAMLRSL